jgi:hypothetical protein
VDGQFYMLRGRGSLLQEQCLNGEYITHVVNAKKPAKGESVTAECSGMVAIN